MSTAGVVAVVSRPCGLPVAGQNLTVDAVLTGDDALAHAVNSGAEWLWLLETGVRPDSAALEHLLSGTSPAGDPAASMVSGMVLDGFGSPIEDWLPAPEFTDSGAILRLVERRLLPIRHAPFANCLIRRSCFDRYGVPDATGLGPYPAREWTARVLSHEPGYFAPLGVARLVSELPAASSRDALTGAYYALRLARNGTLTKGEALRTLMRLRARSARR